MPRLTLALVLVLLSGCGYALQQGGRNRALDQAGVRTVYVGSFQNSTYKPGVENLVHNQILRGLAARGAIRITSSLDEADAILNGNVTDATYAPGAGSTADQFFPKGVGPKNLPLANEYAALLACSFSLQAYDKKHGKGAVLWASPFTRSKTFPANNQLGVFGTTSQLSNDSEFDRALRDLAEAMSQDVNESLFSMF